MKRIHFVEPNLAEVISRILHSRGERKNLVLVPILMVAFFLYGCNTPQDAEATCIVTAPEFQTWFDPPAGSLPVPQDSVANPADSVNFPDIPNCTFYQWSEHMFLWLTSPAPVTYGGGGGRIFNSPAFFDVSPLDSNNSRTFIPHESGKIRFLQLRDAQAGPHNLPVIMDKSGRLLEIVKPVTTPSGRQLIQNASGEQFEISRAIIGKNGLPIFFDIAGKEIPNPRPIIPPELSKALVVQKFIIGNTPIFLDASGNVVDVEQGQALDGVLEAQTGSLVYYATMVNDVYAYFLTGAKNGGITPTPTHFPTTPTELNQITAFASAHGKSFPDPNALAVEVKTSWIETAGLSNPNSYITMKATIPTYDKSNPKEWIPNGQKTVQLAMVGIHVVGSTKGHPEMIWATFEHVNNTPNTGYQYTNTSNHTVTIPQITAGNWLFAANNSVAPFNVEHMFVDASNSHIKSTSGFNITPSNTIRSESWGMDSGATGSNTDVIAINNSIRGMLASGDVRNNYIMIGATWTPFGIIPTPDNGVGTNKLANTTMETYQQGTNCFSCHMGPNMLGDNSGFGLSHIYGPLKPLIP